MQDIIRADVKDLFEARRARIQGTNLVSNFWRTTSENPSLEDEQRKQLAELASEKRELLRSLLGIEEITSDDFGPGLWNPLEEINRRLQFLPGDKRQQMKLLLAQETFDVGSSNSVERERETRKAIENVLTPEELRELDLRESILAAKLRAGLDKMEPSEQEFRMIYQCWERMEAAKALGGSAYQRQKVDSEAQIRQLVGSQRFEYYSEGMKGWE